MVQSPSWEANWFAACQEIPRISRNPKVKVHYRSHKRSPPVPILGQPNPVHIPTSHLLQIHPNIIDPSTPRSPQWYLFLRFPHQDPIQPPLLNHTRHMPSPSQSIKIQNRINTKWHLSLLRMSRFLQYYLLYWRYICFFVAALSTFFSLLISIEVYPFTSFLTFIAVYNWYVLKMWFLSLVLKLAVSNVCSGTF